LAALEPYEDAIAAGETVDPTPGTSLVIIKYQHTDPQMAQKIANTLAEVFIKNNDEIMASAGEKTPIRCTRRSPSTRTDQEGTGCSVAFAKANDLPLTSEQGSNLEQVNNRLYAQLLEAENQRRNQLAAYEAAKNSRILLRTLKCKRMPASLSSARSLLTCAIKRRPYFKNSHRVARR